LGVETDFLCSRGSVDCNKNQSNGKTGGKGGASACVLLYDQMALSMLASSPFDLSLLDLRYPFDPPDTGLELCNSYSLSFIPTLSILLSRYCHTVAKSMLRLADGRAAAVASLRH
jgi:hypothetical protein